MRKHTRILAAAMTIVEAIVIISLTGCSGKKVDYNMETENINTKAGSDISAFDDSTKWNDSFAVETSDKSVDVDISADITLPDCKSMSVVEVKNIKVGADFKKSVIEAYFGDSTVYYHDIPHYTKEEIYHSMEVVKNEIAGYQQEIDAGLITEEGVSRVMKSENDLLEQYEKAEPSALDTREIATDYTDCNEYLGYIGNVFCELRFGIAEDGSLEYISADITLPDCKSMSVVEVKNIKVGADFKKSVIEAYFGDSTVYYHDIPHYTKEEIYHSMEVVKNEIAGYQQEIDAGLITEEGVSRVMKSENDLLEQYEKAEPSALDTREIATDYTDCNEYLGYIGNVFCELRFGIAEDGSLEYISAQPLKAGSEGTLYDDSEYGYYGPPSFAEEKGVEGFNGGSTGGDTTSSYDNECALSKDEAIKKAEEFQNKLGRASQVYIGTSDYEWSAGVIEDGDDTVKTDDKESVIKDTAWGYIIDYGEGVDGIAFCKSLDFTRNMDIWDTLDNYDDFMPYGSSSFIVTDQGVTEFTVSYPVDIVNESKNVELLSMDTIKEIIKDDMTKNSDQYDFTQNHTYNNLKLGYIRLKDASDKDKCTYVPAWCLSKQDKGYDRYPVYVNAIDGTIIRSDDLI